MCLRMPCEMFKAPPCPPGEHSGALTEGPEYETLYALGGCCGVFDPEIIIKGDELCDEYGLDTISMGVSVGFAMECYEKEIITSRETEGIELSFGNGEALLKLIRDTAYRRGFGAEIAKGTRTMAKEFGKVQSLSPCTQKGWNSAAMTREG